MCLSAQEFISYRIERQLNISHLLSKYIAFAKSKYLAERGFFMNNKTIKDLAVEFTVEITETCDKIKGRSVFTNQILRSCSSIGANSYEAKYAQSKADFINKLEIALKECYETQYWLEILFKVNAIDNITYNHLNDKCGTIRRKLIASITTAKSNQ